MGLSLMTQGALSGGITSLIQGGNIKDALKGALMGGAIAGISSGAKGFLDAKKGQGIQGFKSGFMKSAPTIIGGGGQDFKQIMDFNKGAPSEVSGDAVFSAKNTGVGAPETGALNPTLRGAAESGNVVLQKEVAPSMYEKLMGKVPQGFKDAFYTQGTEGSAGMNLADAAKAVSKQFPTLDPSGPVYQSHVESLLGQGATEAVKGSIKLVPTIGAGLALAAPMGLYDPIPEKELEDPYDGTSPSEDRLAENPERYRVGVPDVPYLRATMDDVVVPSQEQLLYEQYLNQPQYAAAGGEMQNFPRRNGYIAGRGTETSDSIPAMLSDGEFVMNARAVRGAGNGSREKGVRKMYDIMRAFEGGAVA
jgi:hypothetical protein